MIYRMKTEKKKLRSCNLSIENYALRSKGCVILILAYGQKMVGQDDFNSDGFATVESLTSG